MFKRQVRKDVINQAWIMRGEERDEGKDEVNERASEEKITGVEC